MNSVKSARVFWDERGNGATLVAYHRLHTRYLVLLFERSRAWHGLVSFAAILDAIPIASVEVAGVQLLLDVTLDRTLEGWLTEIYAQLAARCAAGAHASPC